MSKADDTRLKEIRDRFELWYEADAPQRKREEEPLRMYALDQWPDAVFQSRQAQQGNGVIPSTPARPCLVLDMLREPVHQIVNQERESDLAVEIIPADDFGSLESPIDPSEIELREGIIRRIQRESESASARTWAFTRAAICGRGYYAINTRYAEGKTFDQDVYCRRILNQGGVLLDPAHEEPDGSDSSGGFIFSDLAYDAYKAEYPRAVKGPNPNLACSNTEWAALMDDAPGWFTQDGEKKYVRVAEHWYTDYSSRVLCHLTDGNIAWKDELPEGAPEPRATRSVMQKAIKWCKLDGCQILDETDWPSPFVPIIKIVGNEIPPHKDERRVDGLINKSAIESQRGRNYMGSRIAEEFGLATPSPLVVIEGTIEGYEEWWNQSSTRAFAYLPVKPTDLEGRPAQPPFRPDKNVNVGQMAQAMQLFMESLQSATNVSSPQMGKPSRYSETWRGTKALIDQGERGTSNYMDNLGRSVRYEGRIINSLLYTIYGRPGRMTRIVKGEGDAESVPIGVPFTTQDNGQGQQIPVRAPQGATSQTDGVRQYVLTQAGGSANVAVKVTKGYDTRRQEEAAMLSELLQQSPGLMSIIGDNYFRSQDTPGSQENADRMELTLDPRVLAYIQAKKGGKQAPDPMMMQQMQQLQQQLQEVTQAAQGMQQQIQTEQVKAQTDKEIAQYKADSEERMLGMKLASQEKIEQAKIHAEDLRMLGKQESAESLQHLSHAQDLELAATEAALTPTTPAIPQV